MSVKFKPGQKVRAVHTSMGGDYIKGNTYVVKGYNGSSLKTERDEHGSTTNGWQEFNFTAVDEPSVPGGRTEQLERLWAVRIEFDRMAYTERKAAIAYLTAHFSLT